MYAENNPFYEKVIDDIAHQHYSVADNFFTLDEISALRDGLLVKYEEDQFKKSAIGNQFNEQVVKAIRGDFICWLDAQNMGEAEKHFFSKINDFVDYLNRTCFLGIVEKEFHYAIYPPGTYYKRHLDAFVNDDRRRLSIVCYLNDEDWQNDYGGELAIYLNKDGKEQVVDIYPLPGRMVIFESQLLEHEVKPVKHERLSITGWLKTRGQAI
ncbi:2OG-Fe(II) oxygenase [Flavobacterium rhizosphaerae]|uniref:2OG-Fe(II) oxygenase n=1 Tax=Flavobacterium rhizosphaerae TaxID=3163298 RepID=A0ABW8YYB5_9FLAO